jgi:hypothetical protein
MGQPKCRECGRFIPYSRATLYGGLDGFPSPSWEEWWDGVCEKCEAKAEKYKMEDQAK